MTTQLHAHTDVSEDTGRIESLTITLPLPHRLLSPNHTVGSRGGRMAKASKAKKYRALAKIEAISAMNGAPKPLHERATLRIQWFHKTLRFPDPMNITAWLKAGVDGIVDSGFLNDDRHLSPLPPEIAKDAKNPRVVLTITPTP